MIQPQRTKPQRVNTKQQTLRGQLNELVWSEQAIVVVDQQQQHHM